MFAMLLLRTLATASTDPTPTAPPPAVVVTATVDNSIAVTLAQVATGVLGALAIVIFGYLAIALIVRAVRLAAKDARMKPTLTELAVAAIRGIGLLVILSSALQALGLSQIALAIGGSISLIALGIATAASGALGDIIAGVFLASDPDFGIGFTITTSEIVGTIEHVDLRKTRVRTADGKLHVIPNKLVENNPWVVQSHPGEKVIGTPSFHLPSLPNLPNFPHRPGTVHPAPPANTPLKPG